MHGDVASGRDAATLPLLRDNPPTLAVTLRDPPRLAKRPFPFEVH